MNWSRAEFRSLVTKAARGAGAPPEQAGRFGQAAVVHMISGHEAPILLDALEALPEGPILANPREIDVALSTASAGFVEMIRDASDVLFESYVLALPFSVEVATGKGDKIYRVTTTAAPMRRKEARVIAPDDLVGRLTAFAQAVLVPESEASRSSGAGAGLDDND